MRTRPIIKVVTGIGAIMFTTYFVVKGVVLRVSVTAMEVGLFFLGLVFAIFHTILCWHDEKQKHHQCNLFCIAIHSAYVVYGSARDGS